MTKIINTIGLKKIPNELKIARYFTREKFEKLIKANSIWFSNATFFNDNRERQMPEAFFNGWVSEQKDFYKGIANWIDENVPVYISCWTKFDSENYALWKIYDPNSTGVCIVTTVGELIKQISREDVLICEVDYLNPNDMNLKIDTPWVEYNDVFPFHTLRIKEKYKILPYKFEEEIRAIIYDSCKREGLEITVNPKELVKEIYINPFMSKENVLRARDKIEQNFGEEVLRESIIDEK